MVHVVGELFVHIAEELSRYDYDPGELFQPLNEIGDFNVGITVTGVINFQSYVEQRIDFIEEQGGVAGSRHSEYANQDLLCLADVLTYNAGQIDFVQNQAKITGQDLNSHCLACPALSDEQGIDAFTYRMLVFEAGKYPLGVEGDHSETAVLRQVLRQTNQWIKVTSAENSGSFA